MCLFPYRQWNLANEYAIIIAAVIVEKKIYVYQKLSTSHEDVGHPSTIVFNTCILQNEVCLTCAV